MKYNLAVCGGTFDHFHKGHKEFLRYALSLSRKLLIGLTTEKYIKAKNSWGGIESYKLRKQQLEKFLHKENAIDRVLIEPIDDIFVPKVWESLPIDAIIVSENTVSAVEKINLKRKEQGKLPLKIEVFSLIKSEDIGYISSSRIRNGEINRDGRHYINPLWLSGNFFITKKLRGDFKRPFGTLFRKTKRLRRPECPYLIAVGDITTKTFNDLNFNQNISVVDFKVARKKKFSDLTELGFSGREKIFKVNNPAGCLTPALFKTVCEIFKLKVGYKSHLHPERAQASRRISLILQVEGEEDLSVLPLTLAAPLGSTIFYGQPGEGVVKVEATEKAKEMAYDFISQFKFFSPNTRGY